MSNQEHLDADVQALLTGITEIEAEIEALKTQAPESLDFTALDAAVARITSDATPTPPVEPPVAPTA